jgi:glycosyltransferase involved in cell wall biosynthesis
MSGSHPKVTIIMIVYNGARLIHESIRSVLKQTYLDHELLVVDDGSTDDTSSIVEDFIRKHPGRIRRITHPDGRNHGMSATRRLGVESSSSPLLMFLDHDDLLMPSALGEMVERMDDHPDVAVTFGPNERFWTDEDGRDGGRPTVRQSLGFGTDRITRPPGITAVFLSDSSNVPISPMMRRSAYLETGGYEREFKGMYEDQVFLTKLLLTQPAYIDSRSWIRYRQHASSCVARSFTDSRNAIHRRRFLIWLRRHMAANHIHNAQISAIIDVQMRLNRVARRRERRMRLLRLIKSE